MNTVFPEPPMSATADSRQPRLPFDRPLPLELIPDLPDWIDGSAGLNRSRTRPSINARNDLQAIHCWIDYLAK